MSGRSPRRPESVLVIVHDAHCNFLLIRRRDLGFWQSITGSLEWHERDVRKAACRELAEETGLSVEPSAIRTWPVTYRFRILPELAGRFEPGVTHNTEHLLSVAVDGSSEIRLNSGEHDGWRWFTARQALLAAWSWSNRMGIRRILAARRADASFVGG